MNEDNHKITLKKFEHDEYDLILILIKKTKESLDRAFNELLELYEESREKTITGKKFINKTLIQKRRRRIHVIRTNFRSISSFVSKTLSAFHNSQSLRLEKYKELEEVINQAEKKMWVRLRTKKNRPGER